MISARLKRRSDKTTWRVVGREGSMWSLAPEKFGPTIAASPLEVADLFTVVAEAPAAEIEPTTRVAGRSDRDQAGYEALAAAHIAALDAPREPAPLAPEESLAAANLTAAEIAGDPRYAWAFASGRLAVSARVAGEVDKLLRATA